MVIEALAKKANRDMILDLNTILKNMYKYYISSDKIMVPSDMDSILTPTVFNRSVVVTELGEQYDFLKNTIVDPEFLNKALRNKYYDLILENNTYYLADAMGDKYLISKQITAKNIQDMSFYKGLSDLNEMDVKEYPIQYTMDSELKESLLNYDVPIVTLGNYEGIDVNMIMTIKLFPAIKKADNISFLVKPYSLDKDNIFDVCIISKADAWTLYTMHRIIVI